MQDDVGFSVSPSEPDASTYITTTMQSISVKDTESFMSAPSIALDADIEMEDSDTSQIVAEEAENGSRPRPVKDPAQRSIAEMMGHRSAAPTVPEPDEPAPVTIAPRPSRAPTLQGPLPKIQTPTTIEATTERDPFGFFCLARGDTVDTSFDSTPDELICREFQLGGYHPFDLCARCEGRELLHICSFCRKGNHSCARCPHGGLTRIAEFKQAMQTFLQ